MTTESKFIGVVRGATTGNCYAVIDPDNDVQLDDIRHLMLRPERPEPLEMIKVLRSEAMDLPLEPDGLRKFVDRVLGVK